MFAMLEALFEAQAPAATGAAPLLHSVVGPLSGPPPTGPGSLIVAALVLERQVHLGAERGHLAVLDH